MNTRDVRLFATVPEIRALWPRLVRYLGRARSMWAHLLGLPDPEWPSAASGKLSIAALGALIREGARAEA